jgi:hypothetical protein
MARGMYKFKAEFTQDKRLTVSYGSTRAAINKSYRFACAGSAKMVISLRMIKMGMSIYYIFYFNPFFLYRFNNHIGIRRRVHKGTLVRLFTGNKVCVIPVASGFYLFKDHLCSQEEIKF